MIVEAIKIVGLTKQYNLPISAICFGEDVEDIREFSAAEYAKSIFE
jgi:signal recognition particle GTPase